MPDDKNILVTGGTGLLGAHVIRYLLNEEQKVKAIYRTTIPAEEWAKNVEWILADILDIDALENAMQNVQQVYHCAATVSFSPGKEEELYKVNVEGTANVVNACLNNGIEKLGYVSSVSVFGKKQIAAPYTEAFIRIEKADRSRYGESKHLAEMEVWRGIGEGLQAVIINPSIILGVGDWDKTSTALFKQAYKEFPWFTEGVTGFVDVQDVAKALYLLMESDIEAERFIVSAHNLSYKQLFEAIAKGFNKKPPHKKVTPLIAAIVWRLEALKSLFTNNSPLVTKETAHAAQQKIYFDNSKLLKALPGFTYTPIEETIAHICNELKQRYNL